MLFVAILALVLVVATWLFGDQEGRTELVITDVIVGEGAEATAGQTAIVHYVGVAYSTGEEFDASYNRGDTLDMNLLPGSAPSRARHRPRRGACSRARVNG